LRRNERSGVDDEYDEKDNLFNRDATVPVSSVLGDVDGKHPFILSTHFGRE
jgi:hypothetical protein